MTEQEFVDIVMKRLSFGRRFRAPTRESIERGVRQFFEHGYSTDDAVRAAKCFEEFNPKLDEAPALRRMKEIADKYPEAVAARKQFQ